MELLLSSIIQRVQGAIKGFRFPGAGGYGGSSSDSYGWSNLGGQSRLLPGSEYDYRREVGNLWENSIVYACLSWQANQFGQAPLAVEDFKVGEKNPTYLDDHLLPALIRRPNKFWSARDLWGATLLSLNVGPSSYWVKIRSASGKVVELWWIPHWLMWPMYPVDGSEYISHYRYRVNGVTTDYKVEDVVHFRSNILNPLNTRISLSSFGSSLREICTENEIATSNAALFRNRGLPGVILSPKEPTAQFTPEQANTVKRLWSDTFSGDGAGKVFASNLAMDVNIPQFEPDKMGAPQTQGASVSRICAGFGIDPMVIGLSSEQKTYSNLEEANRGAWDHNLIPTQDIIGDAIQIQLMPDFDEDPNHRTCFDNSRVRALQEDRDALYKRISLAVGGPWMTPNEGRAEATFVPLPDGDELVQTVQSADPEKDDKADDKKADTKKKWLKGSALKYE